ncbi:MATE family efflux transporter [Bacillus tianshenii]|nr:MATE family efflux transporter [Bacillus tianshenii]
MRSNTRFDFTEGSILSKMLLFSGPIFMTNILQTSYQFIDSIWVGNLIGSNALGAISVSATVIFTILSFIIGINSASLTILSQQQGRNDEQGLKESLNAFIVVLTLLSMTAGVVGIILSGPILKLLGTPTDIYPLARSYLQINFLGIVFLFGYNFIGTVLRGIGDSKTPIRFVFIAVVLNTVLDPIFISLFDLGIVGAALATIVSQGAAFLYGVIYSLKTDKIPFTKPHIPAKKYVKAIFKLGIPSGFQMMAISGGMMAIMSVVTRFGEDAVAGFGAAQRIDSLIVLPAMTLGSAVNSIAGQNIGANHWNRVQETARVGIKFILLVMFSVSTFVFFAGEYLIKLFTTDKETIEFGTMYMRTIAYFYPFLGINFVLNGVVRASGAMVQILVLNIISFWVLRFPLASIVSSWMGEKGIAVGMGLSLVVSSFISYLYYRYGKWSDIKIFENE